MFTSGQLNQQLADCERQIVAIRLKAEEKKLVQNERLEQVHAKQQECLAEHRAGFDESVREYEQALEGFVSTAEQDMAALEEKKAKAIQRTADADARVTTLAAEAHEIECRIKAVHVELDAQEAEHNRRYAEMRRLSDVSVARLHDQCREAVQGASTYASEVQETALDAIVDMQEQARTRVWDADMEAKQRSRFDEMHLKLLGHQSQDLTAEEFFSSKKELLQAWLDDWVDQSKGRSPESPSRLTEVPSSPLKPFSSERTRSVERQSVTAGMRQQKQIEEGVQPWGEFRPGTAP